MWSTSKKRKRKTRKKEQMSSNKLELQSGTLDAVVPVIILTAFTVLIFILIIGAIRPNDPVVMSEEEIETALWEKSFRSAEETKVGIVFDDITTNTLEFNQLRNKCNEYLKFEALYADANVEVDTVIDEKQFVDGNIDSITNKREQMAETGPIYFQDMLMLRYINNLGDMHVITAMYNTDKSMIEVVNKEDLIIKLDMLGYLKNDEYLNTTNTSEEIKETEDDTKWTTEDEYLGELSNTVTQMLLARTAMEIKDAEKLAVKYFTMDGNQMVFGNRNRIGLMENSKIKVKHIQAGKSDLSKTYKDRVYMELELLNGAEKVDIYLILKMNTYLRVFDIDIL